MAGGVVWLPVDDVQLVPRPPAPSPVLTTSELHPEIVESEADELDRFFEAAPLWGREESTIGPKPCRFFTASFALTRALY
jgi:hypothetical protein